MQSVDDRLLLSPSDLNDYVECPHLTTLALEVARGQRERPHVPDEQSELLQRKGAEHERAYLERLKAEGRAIVEIDLGEPWDFDAAARRTAEAMRDGAEVISQATFVNGPWRGRADFLLKVEQETALGNWGYEPLDAKLARAEKPTYVLQAANWVDAQRRVVAYLDPSAHAIIRGSVALYESRGKAMDAETWRQRGLEWKRWEDEGQWFDDPLGRASK